MNRLSKKFQVGFKKKALIIGAGRIGYSNIQKSNCLSYFGLLKNHSKFKIISVVEKNKNKILFLQKKYKKINFYYNLKKSLKKKLYDLIIISSPDQTHYKILNTILDYEPKLILMEKPICQNYSEFVKIKKKLEFSSSSIIVNYSRRFNKDFQNIKKKINKNFFGHLQNVTMYCNGGIIHNGCHLIDLNFWWFGKPKKILFLNLKKSKLFKNDYTCKLVLFYKGFLSSIVVTSVANLGNAEIDLIGSKKRLLVDCDAFLNYFNIVKHETFPGYKKFNLFSKNKINFKYDLSNALNELLKSKKMKNIQKQTIKNSENIFSVLNKIYGKGVRIIKK